MPSRRRRGVAKAAWPQAVAVLTGVLFVVLGVVGFGATGLDGFADNGEENLFGLGLNPLHNLVHLAIGVGGILLSSRLRGARRYGWVLVAVFGAAFAYGSMVTSRPDADFLNTNWPVNWLHLVFAALGLLIALAPATPRPVPARDDLLPPIADQSPGTARAGEQAASPAEPSVVEPVAKPRERLREQA